MRALSRLAAAGNTAQYTSVGVFGCISGWTTESTCRQSWVRRSGKASKKKKRQIPFRGSARNLRKSRSWSKLSLSPRLELTDDFGRARARRREQNLLPWDLSLSLSLNFFSTSPSMSEHFSDLTKCVSQRNENFLGRLTHTRRTPPCVFKWPLFATWEHSVAAENPRQGFCRLDPTEKTTRKEMLGEESPGRAVLYVLHNATHSSRRPRRGV